MDSDDAHAAPPESEPTVIEKPEHNFALYACRTLLNDQATINGTENEKYDPGCDDTSETESCKDSNVNISLSIIATDLTASEETELRHQINVKITKGNLLSGPGMVASISLQASEDDVVVKPGCHGCYHRLFSSPTSEKLEWDAGSRDFIVCFLTKQERGLELFQPELDKYSENLIPQLDKSFSSLETSVKTYLESWFVETVEYVNRCVTLLGPSLQYIIHAALVDMTLEVTNAPARHKVDMERFLTSCSLTDVLRAADVPYAVTAALERHNDVKPNVLLVNMANTPPEFENADTTGFCEDWTETLVQAANSSPFCLRQIIENYKLKVIQDMNHLRRMLRQAEMDHYALFRTYSFLRCSANCTVLMHQAQQHSMTPQTGHVVRVLDRYLKQKVIKDSAS